MKKTSSPQPTASLAVPIAALFGRGRQKEIFRTKKTYRMSIAQLPATGKTTNPGPGLTPFLTRTASMAGPISKEEYMNLFLANTRKAFTAGKPSRAMPTLPSAWIATSSILSSTRRSSRSGARASPNSQRHPKKYC